MTRYRRVAILVALLTCLGLGSEPASAASPRILLFSGAPLTHPIVISDWQRIFRFYVPTATSARVTRSQLAARPRLRVSLFWGPRWIDYLAHGRDPQTLRPRDADQTARFYPAWHGHAALFDLPSVWRRPRTVPAAALAILGRYGVPLSSR
jgi:hypothetical protein